MTWDSDEYAMSFNWVRVDRVRWIPCIRGVELRGPERKWREENGYMRRRSSPLGGNCVRCNEHVNSLQFGNVNWGHILDTMWFQSPAHEKVMYALLFLDLDPSMRQRCSQEYSSCSKFLKGVQICMRSSLMDERLGGREKFDGTWGVYFKRFVESTSYLILRSSSAD